MRGLFRLDGASADPPEVAAWFEAGDLLLRAEARRWYDRLRGADPGTTTLLHDGCPTVCIDGAAMAYVGAFTAHVSIGFFQGAALPDPAGLLRGSGKYMRRVRLSLTDAVDEAALVALIATAAADLRQRLADA